MATVEGIRGLRKKLKAIQKKYGTKNASVTTGFTQRYAIYVHENLEARHDTGEAKFLENAFKKARKRVTERVTQTVQNGGDLETALLRVGLLIQRIAQDGEPKKSGGVPVKYGALKNSAFTVPTRELEQAAAQAFLVSEQTRIAGIAREKKKKAKSKKKK